MSDTAFEPLITVGLPIYNGAPYLRSAVLSIVAQTYLNWELLLIDDGSTDSSIDSVSDIRDSRITLLRDGRNKGAAARLNEAVDLARGQFFARMDQDDISYPTRFASQITRFRCDPQLDLLAVRAIKISNTNDFLGFFPSPASHADICSSPWRGFYMPHPTWMGRIQWFRKYRYRIPESYFSDDQELLLRSYRDSHFACLSETLFAYRIHDKIRWRKRFKTRWTVLKLQAASFIGSRQYGFLLRAGVVFLLRLGSDFWMFLTRPFPGISRGQAAPMEKGPAVQQWLKVREVYWPSKV
jgi:glycosyltransferase involved in cell wall biosynthesis